MKPRRAASWQRSVDDRILELLAEESYSTPSVMELEPYIHATETQIRERCMVLADADLVGIDIKDGWRVELTTRGRLYLDGEADVELYDRPRPARSFDEGTAEWLREVGPF
jgi:hypothetical protein